ncbi:phytoene desaturase family protein [Oceanidesulfovibrio indonesiensis]|nr:NAD(P)/FAD-dependent oxidoreductase [Oceanidesulfovibrio indonesiensis]
MTTPTVIVIGGGMAGLTAAALLARRGFRVTLVEKERQPGGYVTGFMRAGHTFDSCCAFLSACTPGGAFHALLAELGLADELEFLPIGQVRNAYPDFVLDVNYTSPSAHLDAMVSAFPEHANQLNSYAGFTAKMGREILDFDDAPLWKKLLMPVLFPTMFRCARLSHGQVLSKFFDDPRIVQGLSALPSTLPPSRLSYAFVGVLWSKVLDGGVFYPKGGMASISSALVRSIKQNGGQVLTAAEVESIKINEDRICEVELSNGETIAADWFVGAANPYHLQKRIEPSGSLYNNRFDLARYTPSGSAALYYCSVPDSAIPADWPYFVSIHTGRDPEATGTPANRHIVVTTPTLLDPTMAPAGSHSLKVMVHLPGADKFANEYPDVESRERFRREIFAAVAAAGGPDLDAHGQLLEKAMPETLERITANEHGAMYGLDAAVGQVGPWRPPITTRLDNLFWCGHYVRPSHGIVGSALSGKFAADTIARKTA